MQSLCPSLSEKNVFLWKNPLDLDFAIGLMYDSLVNGSVKFDAYKVWSDMELRTKQGIYMGNGLLLPHARANGILKPLIAFGASPQGFLNKNPLSNQEAKMICMVISPEISPTDHTKVIACMAKKVLNPEWVKSVLSCDSSREVFALLG